MATADIDEYKRLKDAALEMEKLLSASPHGVNPVAATILASIQKRLVVLENEIKEAEGKARIEQAVAAAEAAERETALNREEKSIFAGFMRKEYFTKKDFGELELFYKTSWDKLTDEGKHEMTSRIQESIKRGVFKFHELPALVREDEAGLKETKEVQPKNEQLSQVDLSSIDFSQLKMTDGNTPSISQMPGNAVYTQKAR